MASNSSTASGYAEKRCKVTTNIPNSQALLLFCAWWCMVLAFFPFVRTPAFVGFVPCNLLQLFHLLFN